jgi:hypothetical protein
LQIRSRSVLSRKKLEPQSAFGTFVHTIQAQVTFGLMPRYGANRIVSSLAMEQATIAVVALLRILHKAKHRPSGSDPEQSAQRAQSPAPEPGNPEIQCQKEQKDKANPKSLAKVGLAKIQQHCPEQKMEYPSDRLHKGETTVLKRTQYGLQRVVRRWQNG